MAARRQAGPRSGKLSVSYVIGWTVARSIRSDASAFFSSQNDFLPFLNEQRSHVTRDSGLLPATGGAMGFVAAHRSMKIAKCELITPSCSPKSLGRCRCNSLRDMTAGDALPVEVCG